MDLPDTSAGNMRDREEIDRAIRSHIGKTAKVNGYGSGKLHAYDGQRVLINSTVFWLGSEHCMLVLECEPIG